MSAKGNITLGIVVGNYYQNLESALNNIIKTIKETKQIIYKNVNHSILYFWGGDWMVTASCLGIKGPTENIYAYCAMLKKANSLNLILK